MLATWRRYWGSGNAHQALVLGQEDGDTSVDLADCERDKHCVKERADGQLIDLGCMSRFPGAHAELEHCFTTTLGIVAAKDSESESWGIDWRLG